MAVNYLGFAQAANASNPMAAGLKQLSAAIEARREQERLAPQEAQAATLRNLQIQQAQAGIDETTAKRNALSDLYGTKGQPDEYSRALSFQAQQEQELQAQKASAEKAKFAMDGYMKVSEAVKNGVIPEDQAGNFYHNALRMAGVDLDKSGVKMEFKKQGGYYSGPVTPDSLFMMNGKPTPYGGVGTISKARIAGIDPTTNKPIFEMTADTTFAQEATKEQPETWGEPYQTKVGGKVAMVQKSSRGQVRPVVQDVSTTVVVKGGGRDQTPQGKILPAGQLESVADMKRVKDVLAEANDVMNTGKVSTGPLAGRSQSLASKVGLADDTFVDLQQKLQTAQNIMLKLRSGAAVTESEYARFLKEYPTPNDTPEVFKRKMQNTLNYANTLMDDKMQIYEEGGYRVPQSVRGNKSPKAAPRSGAGPKQMVTKGGFKVTVVK